VEAVMIDWGRVACLREEIGADGFEEVVALFLEEVDELMARFRNAPEVDRMEQDLHFLKGSALNLGFDDLGSLCLRLERQAADGQAAQIDLAQVVSLYDATRRAFEAATAANVRAAG